jgi:hypothetical protein
MGNPELLATLNERYRKPKEQSRMGNPEPLATLNERYRKPKEQSRKGNPELLATLNERYRKLKGQSRMGNPELLATLGTQNTGLRQTKHKNTIQKTKDDQHGPYPGDEPRCSRRESSSCII